MSLTKQTVKAGHAEEEHKLYPTWEAFVQASVDGTNALLSQMDKGALRKLIDSKKKSSAEEDFDRKTANSDK
ncbi:hypothetical protein [Spirosoma utsteinense]|uniref:Uncharacterized protein n=1 Tax=Spirosoma utsteinense TaxID=2585773 RepID=A0ABR6W2A6_9BACT|nr:hypothetical protein [Spirosoma utsteinense]MBC3786035.1 hypothetical protein [Spirosoma utsteinense]MBC3790733.1 hypothetical protein [Spirosoma utsteinense]